MHAEEVSSKSCMLNRFKNKKTPTIVTCSQIMHAKQVQKSQFDISITCSQIMHTEQILKSQLRTVITCSQIMHFKITV